MPGGLRFWRSDDFLTSPPPGEKATARQDQAGKASTGDGTGNCYGGIDGVQKYVAGVLGRGDIQELKTPRIVNVESSLAAIARAKNRAGENIRTTRNCAASQRSGDLCPDHYHRFPISYTVCRKAY